jgi:formylglycine-generating enzyme required for sulfatase activity
MSLIKRLMAALGSKRNKKVTNDTLAEHQPELPIVSNDPYLEVLIAEEGLEKAMHHASNELALYSSQFGEDHVLTTLRLIRVGELHLDLEQYDQAKAFFEKALEIRLIKLDAGHALISECYQDLGVLYYETNVFDVAEKCHLAALEIRLELFGPHHVLTAQTYLSFFHLLLELEKDSPQKAIQYLALAVEGYERAKYDRAGGVKSTEEILELKKTLFEWQAKTGQLSTPSEVLDQIEANMVAVEGGEFSRVAEADDAEVSAYERPQRYVKLDGFKISRYPVTEAQWRAVMGTKWRNLSGCDNCPIESVSWNLAQEFICKLNAQTSKNYRLPTEAEWEFAARGGNKSKGYRYAGSNDINSVAWYTSNSGIKTHPVGQKQANELGIYDMSGNVWEWCEDWYSESKRQRVLRGGSWCSNAEFCRVSNRRYDRTYKRINHQRGFRLVLP